jgi:hypothetical protein
MALICFDKRTRRASPGTKLLFKSAALIGLVGSYAVYNAYTRTSVDAAVDGESGRSLGIFIEGSAGAAVIVYILVSVVACWRAGSWVESGPCV